MDRPTSPRFDNLPSRLRWAIDQQRSEGRQRGLRLFQRRLAAARPGLDGTALSSIQAYLNGSVTPSLGWVEAASQILGVRTAWLAFGGGFPTEAEQDVIHTSTTKGERATAPASANAPTTRDTLGEFVMSVFNEELPAFWRLPPAARRALMDGLARHVQRLVQRGDSFHATYRRYVRYLATPFAVTKVDATSLDPADLAIIVDGLVRAIEIASWNAGVEN